MKPIYTTIPVSLCEHALLNGTSNQLKLLVYLKHISSGHLRFNTSSYKAWSIDIQMSEKWVRNAINDLIRAKLITVNNRINSLRVISYEQLCIKLNLCPKLAAIYEPDDFSKFINFCCAVVFTYYLNKKGWSDKKRRSVSIMGDTSTNRNFCPKNFKTLPIRYLAKCLDVSVSTANNYKKMAVESNFLIIKRQVIIMKNDKGAKLSKDLFNIISVENKNLAGRLRKGTKHLKRVEPDLIKSEIIFKRKTYKH